MARKKEKLRYVNVYTKRNVRDPIDWDLIEEIRAEGWELVCTFGDFGDAIRNPAISPIYAVFKQDKADQIDALEKQLRMAHARLTKYEKKKEKADAGV